VKKGLAGAFTSFDEYALAWTHIDGFSEAAIDYIRELEPARTN